MLESEALCHSLTLEVIGNGCFLRFRLASFALIILDAIFCKVLSDGSPWLPPSRSSSVAEAISIVLGSNDVWVSWQPDDGSNDFLDSGRKISPNALISEIVFPDASAKSK